MKLKTRLGRAFDLTKAFETFEPEAVRRPDGGWVVGYGHTRTAREGVRVSPEDAEALLLYDLGHVATVVEEDVRVPLNPNQLGALTAFAFNIGWDNFRRSSVVTRLNGGDELGAAEEMERWRRADLAGELRVVDALVRRRLAERVRFLTPPGGWPRSSSPLLPPRRDPDMGRPRAPVAVAPTPFPSSAGAEPEAEPPPPPPVREDVGADATRSPFPAASFPSPRVEEALAGEVPPIPQAAQGEAVATRRTSVIDEVLSPEPRPPRLAYVGLGVLGLFLFGVSVDMILTGRPNAGNLLIGLVGVLLMTPAAYFLLGRGSDRGEP